MAKQADIKVGVITNYDDKGLKQAQTGLAGFKTSIAQADGFTGKLKAGLGSLGASVKSFISSPAGMLAAGGAIAAAGDFALKAVSKFSGLGVEIGKLADATGLTNEAASRWAEVAGDIGVDTGTLEGSIGKLNKTLGTSPGLFEDAGIAIGHTKDGAVDVNETFLNTIDRLNGIKDPAERAKVATQLLGKGWQSMAELIEQGSGSLKTSLADVADVKVFDDDKVAKARAFRDATDDLKDVMEDFTLEVGEKATPALLGLAEAFKLLPTVLSAIANPIGEVAKAIGRTADEALRLVGIDLGKGLDGAADAGVRATESMQNAGSEFSDLRDKGESLKTGTDLLADAHDGLAISVANAKRKVDTLKESISEADLAYQRFTGELDEEDAWAHVNEAIAEFNEKVDESGNAIVRTAQETRDLSRDIADYVIETNTIPPEKKTDIIALLDQGKLEEAKALLAEVTKNRDIYLNLIARGSGDIIAKLGAVGARAAGGPVRAGGSYLVGEQGPEILNMGSQGGSIVPNNALGGGGVNIESLTINMPPGSDGNAIISEIKKFERRNGPGWRAG